MDKSRFRRNLYRWFLQCGRDLPWRRTRDPYQVLVSEFMLQQTQVSTVVPFFERWMAAFPTVNDLAAADEQRVLSVWQGLGYYSRARNLHRAAATIASEFNGVVPPDIRILRTLAGIGDYTAAAIAAFAFDQQVPVIDANIARVLARLFDYRGRIDTAAGKKWLCNAAASLLPQGLDGGCLHASALMELGATVCTAARPRCPSCPVRKFCRATDPQNLPLRAERRRSEARVEYALFIQANGNVLLERQAGARHGGLWRLPVVARRPPDARFLASLRYSIMHFRVRMEAFAACEPRSHSPEQRWIRVDQLADIPMPSPDRKMLDALLPAMEKNLRFPASATTPAGVVLRRATR